jgi:hypothetical protein
MRCWPPPLANPTHAPPACHISTGRTPAHPQAALLYTERISSAAPAFQLSTTNFAAFLGLLGLYYWCVRVGGWVGGSGEENE